MGTIKLKYYKGEQTSTGDIAEEDMYIVLCPDGFDLVGEFMPLHIAKEIANQK